MTICSKQFSLVEEGGNELGPPRPTPDSLEGLAREVVEFPNVSGTEVGQFVLLPIAPQILDRIEFGSVGGQPLNVQPGGVLLKEVLDQPAAMHRRAVPDQQDPAGQLAMQLAEETDDLGTLDGTGMQLEIEVARQPGDIVLVGHSYAGMVVTGVINKVPERIRCVVFLDAALPQDGESCYDVYGARVRAYKVEDGFIIPSWLDRTRRPPFYVPQPVKTWSDPVSYTNPAAKELPAAYVLFAPKGQAPETAEGYKFLQRARDRGWPTYVMESDHMAHQSHPNELTSLLERLAQDKRKPNPQVPLPTSVSDTPAAGAPVAPPSRAGDR